MQALLHTKLPACLPIATRIHSPDLGFGSNPCSTPVALPGMSANNGRLFTPANVADAYLRESLSSLQSLKFKTIGGSFGMSSRVGYTELEWS